MAIPVTSLTVNTQKEGARSVVRNSSGIPYVIVRSTNFSQTFEIWKGNSTNPTSFSIQDSLGAPNWTNNGSLSMAIDSSDVIHVAYMRDDTKLSKLLYTTFDTGTDTYTSTVTIIDDIGDDPININRLKTSIAIDSNDIPHIAYTENRSNMGSPFFGIYYNNRIGGGWSIEGIEVEGDTTEVRCHYPDITIDSENIPVIVYHNGTTLDTSFDGAKGSANDATSFTLFELDADADPTNNGNVNTAPSVCVDSNGDHWFAYKVNTTGYITLKKHTQTGNS